MANARKNSIHHQIMMRRASRSEYSDGLLRHNQRQENRLNLELEQWEKAQRMVARGLDKESQWFKQNSTSIGYNAQRNPKRNSLTEFSGDGQSRLIPDYQYRNRATIMAQEGEAELEQNQNDHRSADTHENDAERKPTDQTDSSKSHKKHSRSSESTSKKSSSKHGDEKSSHSHRKSRHHGDRQSRDRDSEKRDPDKPASGSSSTGEKKTSKTAADASATSTKQNHKHQSTNDKPTQPKSSTKSSKKHATDNAALSTTPTPSTTTTTTTNVTTTTTTDDTKPESPSKTSSAAPRSLSLREDVHDPGDVLVSPKVLKDLGWDGRRRYTNVWDSLSTPKHASQVRSVRSRLQREFTQIPSTSDLSSSKGFASARRSGRTPSLS